MRVTLLLSFGIAFAFGNGKGNRNHRIFPAAQVESYNPGNFSAILAVVSTSNITFTISGPNNSTDDLGDAKVGPLASSKSKYSVENFLRPAILRFQKSLSRFPEFQDDYRVNPLNLPLLPIKNIEIVVDSSETKLHHDVPEDYSVSITTGTTTEKGVIPSHDSNSGDAVIVALKASTVFGVLRALETFGQLLVFGWMDTEGHAIEENGKSCGNGGIGVFFIRDIPVFVSDKPAFSYRGLMIDTARHYLPLELILENLDAMEMNKLNVLHWHISDTQSFPYASMNLPELATKGAYHPKRIYTVENVKNVIEQAYLRGIRVIPEIDMPGHTNAIAKSHPEVMSHCPHPSEPINPTVPKTYEFVESVYKDLNDTFPDDFVHVGGDEVQLSEACWLKDPSISSWMKAHGMKNHTVELYEYFETRLLQTVSKFEKTPVVWQEVFNLNLTIPPNTIIDVWKGFDKYTIQNATNQNYRVILSGCWYLDHLSDKWQTYYGCEPLNFTSPHKDRMIGGHASMWGEHVDASNFVSRVWPRASAVAERLWHGNVRRSGANNTVADRIHEFRCRMVLQGFAAGPTGPGVCPTEVGYHRSSFEGQAECDLSTESLEGRDFTRSSRLRR